MLMTKISDSKYQPHINKPVLSWFSGVSIVVVTALGGAAVGAGIAASSIGTITALPMVAGALAGTAVGTALALVVIKLIRLVKNKLLKPAKHQAQPVQNQPSSKIKSDCLVHKLRSSPKTVQKKIDKTINCLKEKFQDVEKIYNIGENLEELKLSFRSLNHVMHNLLDCFRACPSILAQTTFNKIYIAFQSIMLTDIDDEQVLKQLDGIKDEIQTIYKIFKKSQLVNLSYSDLGSSLKAGEKDPDESSWDSDCDYFQDEGLTSDDDMDGSAYGF